MGNCCGCLKSSGAAASSSGGGGGNKKSVEMTDGRSNKLSPSLTLSKRMSAPSVEIDHGMARVSGNGLALVGCSIEQDAAYWEWQIERTGGGGGGKLSAHDEDDEDEEENAPKFGVATKKDRRFYQARQALEVDDNTMPAEDGTALMRAIPVRDGDTIGVAVQQSDLPMIQFLLNGEPLHNMAINRFRGSVFPSIYIREGLRAEVVFDEDNFKELSPHARFGPLIAARGII